MNVNCSHKSICSLFHIEMSALSTEDTDLILVLSMLIACFSLLGALSIVVMYAGYENLRSFSYKVILVLALIDGGEAVMIVIRHVHRDVGTCKLLAVFVAFFRIFSTLWILYLSWVASELLQDNFGNLPRSLKRVFFIIGMYSGAVSLLPLVGDAYGKYITGICWIEDSVAWQLFQLYIPLWIVISFILYTYCKN